MESIMVGNATKVAFFLLVTLVVIISCLEVSIGEFDNFLKAQTEEAYKIAFHAYVPNLEDATNELNLYRLESSATGKKIMAVEFAIFDNPNGYGGEFVMRKQHSYKVPR
ncbi:hypothetical protein CR513_39132, partial [Mucuna pruriens]